MTSSRDGDENSFLKTEQQCEELGSTPLSPAPPVEGRRHLSPIGTPSKVLAGKLRELDGLWSTHKLSSRPGSQHSSRSKLDTSSSRANSQASISSAPAQHPDTASRTSSKRSAHSLIKTPTKPLLNKLQSLEQTWTSVKSVSSSRGASVGSSSKQQQSSSSQRPLSLLVPSPTAFSTSDHLKNAPNTEKTKNVRRLLFSAHDDSSSVGGSTISTISSSESVFDRLYRMSTKNRKSTTHMTSPEPSPSNSSATSSHMSYTPKMNSKNRSRDRLRAFQDNSKLSSQSASASVSSTPRSINTDDDDSVFARLHRNEKRKEKLWTAPTSSSLATPQNANTSSPPRNIRQTDKDSVFARLHKNEKRKEKLWTPPTSINPNTPEQLKPSPDPPPSAKTTTLEEDLAEIEAVGKDIQAMRQQQLSASQLDVTPQVANTSQKHKSNRKPTTIRQPDFEVSRESHVDINAQATTATSTTTTTSTDAEWFKEELPSNAVDVAVRKPRSEQKSQSFGFFTLDEAFSTASLVMSDSGSASHRHAADLSDRLDDDPTEFSDRQDDERPHYQQTASTPAFRHPGAFQPSIQSPQEKRMREESSTIVLQKCWRRHRGEIALASKLIRTAQVSLSFTTSCYDYATETRMAAIQQAMRAVDCWWILEGLLVDDDVVNIAWENEIQASLGEKGAVDKVRVSLDIEANSSRLTSSWSRHKLAILLVKAGLELSLQREQRRGPVHAATRIQEAFRHRRRRQQKQRRQKRREVAKVPKAPKPVAPSAFNSGAILYELSPEREGFSDYEDLRSFSSNERTLAGEKLLSELDELESFTEGLLAEPSNEQEIKDPISRRNQGNMQKEQEEAAAHRAAVSIQNWLRISALKSVIQESPQPKMELERVLHGRESPEHNLRVATSGYPGGIDVLPRSDSFPESNISVLSDPFQRYPAFSDLIEKRASALAIHNIIRAYLMALRRYRRIKKAILIQSIWRRYQAQEAYERQRFAAVVIQFAWTGYAQTKGWHQCASIIQRRWKTIRCQQRYRSFRFAAISIQAQWRRWRAMQYYIAATKAILCLQSAFRATPLRRDYLAKQRAAETIQMAYRQVTLHTHEAAARIIQRTMRRSVSIRKLECWTFATILVQSVARRHLAVKNYRRWRNAALTIQRTWRRHRTGQLIVQRHAAATKIQSHVRRVVAMARSEKQRQTVVLLQSLARRYLAQQESSAMMASVRQIQAAGRRCVYRNRFLKMKLAAVMLQASWRVFHDRRSFDLYLLAICTLQSAMRGYQRRVEFSVQRNSVVKIQTAVRCHLQRRRFTVAKMSLRRQLLATSTLQKWFRNLLRRQRRLRRESSIKVQSFWRAALARDRYSRDRILVVSIQSQYRAWSQRRQYANILFACRTIQSCMRRASSRMAFMRVRSATVVLQTLCRVRLAKQIALQRRQSATAITAWARGSRTRQQLVSMYVGAFLIQHWWRRHAAKIRLAALKQERLLLLERHTVRIQSVWRGRRQQLVFQSTVLAATCMQRHWRGASSREKLAHARIAAVMIQATLRMSLVQCQTARLQESALRIQRWWRVQLALKQLVRRRQQQESTNKTNCAKEVQKHWRRLSARRGYIRSIGSVVTIQKHWRAAVARASAAHARGSALLLQALVRGFLCRAKFQTNRRASIGIQRYWRHFKRRNVLRIRTMTLQARQDKNAVIIQTSLRRIQIQRAYMRQVSAAICIQKWRRGATVRSLANQNRAAASMLQATVRVFLVRMRILQLRQSATSIQGAWRGYLARRESDRQELDDYQLRERNVLCIQRVFRGASARWDLEAKHGAALKIQCVWIGYCLHKTFVSADLAAIKIQSAFRRYLAVQEFLGWKARRWQIERCSAIQIQGAWRRWYLAQKDRTKYSAIVVQKVWRGGMARERYTNQRVSAVMIQSVFRHQLAMKAAQQQETALKNKHADGRDDVTSMLDLRLAQAAVILQRCWRSKVERCKYQSTRHAVVTLQKATRKLLASSHFHRLVSKCIQIQSIVRMVQCRRSYQIYTSSAIVLQSYSRSSQAQSRFMAARYSATAIQSLARGRLCRSIQRRERHAALGIQRVWRGTIARRSSVRESLQRSHARATVIQSFYRQKRYQRDFRKLVSGALLVQNVWRRKREQMSIQRRCDDRSTASTTIQRYLRGHRCRNMLLVQSRYVVVIQREWRRATAEHSYLLKRASLVMLQSAVRGSIARERNRRERARRCHAASVVERAIISWALRNQTAKLNSALKIQGWWRMHASQRSLSEQRQACIVIQSIVRKQLACQALKRRIAACRNIQRTARAWRARHSFVVLRQLSASSVIQRYTRGYQSRKALEARQRHAALIQRTWRRVDVENAYMVKRTSSIMLQSVMRGYIARVRSQNEVLRRNRAAFVLQQKIRAYTLRKQAAQRAAHVLRRNSHACRDIQRIARAWKARRQFVLRRHAVVCIQKTWRGTLIRNEFEVQRACAIIIQAAYRRYVVLATYWFLRLPSENRLRMHEAARKIQMAFFLWKVRLSIEEVQSSAILLNRCMRGQLARSAVRFALSHMNASFHRSETVASSVWQSSDIDPAAANALLVWDDSVAQAKAAATVVIQTAARRMIAKNRVQATYGTSFRSHHYIDQRREVAATNIQRCFRHWSSGRALRVHCSCQIQGVYRGWKARRCYSVMLKNFHHQQEEVAARTIQRHERGRICRQRFMRAKMSAIHLQKSWRSLGARRGYISTLGAVVRIQRSIRTCLSKIKARSARLKQQAKSEAAAVDVLNRVVARSEDSVAALHRSAGNAIPCLVRLADRVIDSLHEAAVSVDSTLPEYALQAKHMMDESPRTKDQNTVLPGSPGLQSDVRAFSVESDVTEEASTPVRSNHSSNFGTPPSSESISEHWDRPQEEVLTARMKSFSAGDKSPSPSPLTIKKQGVSSIRFAPQSINAQPSLKQFQSMKIKSKQKASPKFLKQKSNVKVRLNSPYILETEGSNAGSQKEDMFEEGEELPSPIKSAENWDWADEW